MTDSNDTVRAARTQFYLLAQRAIMAGLITSKERDTISRVHTRKEGYWCRHLRDLETVLQERAAQHGGNNAELN